MNTPPQHLPGKPGILAKLCLAVLSCIILSVSPAVAQLSGSYTIDASSSASNNYTSFTNAVSALTSKGVSGAVTFTVAAATFTENITIPAITGSSSKNPIVFKGAGRGKTILKASASSLVLYLNGPSFITFDGMTIQGTTNTANVVTLNVTASCSIINSNILSPTGGSAAVVSCVNVDRTTINNCYLYGAYYGMQCTGSGGSSSSPIGNLVFTNNRIIQFSQFGTYSVSTGGNTAVNNTYTNNVFDSSASANAYDIFSQYESGATYKNNKLMAATAYGTMIYYPNLYFATAPFLVANNFISNFSAYGSIFQLNTSGSNVQYAHNTVYDDSTMKPTAAIQVSNSLTTKALSIQNNIFEILNMTPTTFAGAVYLAGNSAGFNVIDGNDVIAPGASNQAYGYLFNTIYADYASYLKAMRSFGWEKYGTNIKPVYVKSPSNLHLNQAKAAPYAPDAGISTDIDGDSRCKIFPSVGADESNFGKGASILKIFLPKTVYPSSPTIVSQTAKATDPKVYHWYLNGVKVSDSATLVTSGFKVGINKVKLVTITCVNQDSIEVTDTVAAPTAVPSIDFVASTNKISVGETIAFTDVSTNGPTSWQWEITPDFTYINGVKTANYAYVYGTSSSFNPQIKFKLPGSYKVCLTASNSAGKGTTVCKTSYITVYPSINLTSTTSIIHDAQGYLYDDGGPNAPYISGGGSPSVLIDPCADSVYMYFTAFDLNCGVGNVFVYEGRDNKGKVLGKCSAGYTGSSSSSCSSKCLPNLVTDTFKAKNTMFIQMNDNANAGSAGFTAYWWSKAKTSKKPKASFTTANSGDSVCVGHSITMTNTTTIDANDPATFLWDLDGDITVFECVGACKTVSFPYYIKGGVKITLVATNCGGSDTVTKIITGYVPPAPKSDFTVDNTTPTLYDVAFLNPNIPMCVDHYKWVITKTSGVGTASFVNGTSATSASPQVTFSDTGYYDVSLFVDNASGFNSTAAKTKYIHVRMPYCIPGVANLLPDLGITNVVFNTINNKTKPAVTDYTNFANTPSLSTTIEQGISYSLTVKRDSPTYNTMTRTAYIDWNGDGVFGASEVLGVDSNSSSISWTQKVKVPTTAKTGATILRVAVAGGNATNNPCGQNSLGEFQDYRVYISTYHTLPVITLKGHQGNNDTIFLEKGYSYTEEGYSASSLLNGDITSSVNVTSSAVSSSVLRMSYDVTDAGGLKAITKFRIIKFTPDKTPPVLVVGSPDTTLFEVSKTAIHPLPIPKVASATDLVDGTMTASVSIDTANVKTNVVGTYVITYTVTDAAGNTAKAYRVLKVIDTIAPVLTLKGKAVDTIGINTYYVDPGVSTSDNYYTSATLDSIVVIDNPLDTSNYGTYIITYTLTDPSGNVAKSVSRKIVIVDKIPPVIKVKGNLIDSIAVLSTYKDPGYTTFDNLDNVSQIKVKVTGTFFAVFPTGVANVTGDNYTITYTATDRGGNSASVTRIVKVKDWIAPTIHLKGGNVTTVCRWATYVDSGYTLSDNYDKNSDIQIHMAGSFVTKGGTTVEGLYSLRYIATDRAGNVDSSETRAIQVLPYSSPGCVNGIAPGLSLDKYINIYPNPNNGVFTISANMPAQEKIRISVVNMLGQEIAEVHNGIISQNSFKVDLSNQVSGIYFLNIVSENQAVTKRIEIAK